MEKASPSHARFGDFELDLSIGRLWRDGQSVQLGEKPLRVLATLMGQPGQLVTRETLQQKLWPNDTVVDFEHGINTAIKVLRRVLGDSAGTPKYIQTIPRKGYRLIVPVEWIRPSADRNGIRSGSDANNEGSATPPGSARLLGIRVSHYRVIESIGGGGMGVVYRGEDLALGRSVALKFLSEELGGNPNALERFRFEARAVSMLDHPNICPIYEFGEHEGQPFFVMPLLQGRILRDRFLDASARGETIPVKELLDVGLEVLSGLQAAHEKGIIHRDIKPANVFLTESGHAKILDFGVAKLASATPSPCMSSTEIAMPVMVTDLRLTNPGTGLGTLAYMSPEQARGEELDPRTDLFSFGIVLYEMATGALPFHSEAPALVLKAILEYDPPQATSLNPSLPVDLDRILTKALQKDRSLRYQSAAEMSTDLLQLKREAEYRLLAPVATPGLEKRGRRQLYGLVALLVVLVVAGGFVLFYKKTFVPPSRSEWVAVTDFADDATQPALSPDGRMVAFIRGPETFVSQGQIYVKILPDGQPVQLTHDELPKMAPAFSPDGSRIAYTAVDPKFGWNTWVVPVLGGEPHMLLPNAAALTWTDKANVLFSEVKTTYHMGIVTSAESRAGERDVYLPPDTEAMAHRSWVSPDRKWVLLSEMEPGGDWGPCRLVPLGGNGSVGIAGPRAARCTYAGWSPDGNTMYFSADAGDGYHIWRQPFPNGDPEQITFGATEEEGVAITPDGHYLITSAGIRSSTVWLRDAKGDRQVSGEGFSTLPGLGFRGGSCGHSVFAPDGKRIFYLVRSKESRAMNAGELWTTELESGESQPLLPRIAMSEFDISPDGLTVAFAAQQENGAWHTWLAALDRSSPPRLVTDSEASRPCFGSRGDLYFIVHEGSQQFLYALSTDRGEKRKIYPTAVQDLSGISPSGEWLLFGHSPVIARRIQSESPIRICSFCGIGWGPEGKILYLRFRNVGIMGGGRTVAIGLQDGDGFPPLQSPGLDSLDDVRHLKIVANIDMKDIAVFAPGPDPQTFAYSRITIQRNLFRIPIE